ncbi:hypothetical protein HWB07_gp243 [Bacillus phage vB_BsuM-Goe3]|uniref:Uncharacterized protein n=1 Tax=Bacillus phage vB_BsuM-Goe3 TaxID=1933063 RepID=A0A217ER22_BPGO3|nr:hypothetical protein HWB07_gp243 [Bacillus phage vB_BsuM-Goe3]APZ82527.1 hypothetical protein Goe3_c06500 [Bacillus phage vB_BsuM-Goe3]
MRLNNLHRQVTDGEGTYPIFAADEGSETKIGRRGGSFVI